jgi:hypothetical protein
MEVSHICSSCNTLVINEDLGAYAIQELSIFDNLLCSKCNLVIKSKYCDGNISEVSNDSEYLNLPKKSIFFHTNDEVLNEEAENLSKDDIFKDKSVLFIGCGSIKRMPVLQSILNFEFKKIVYLCREKSWARDFFDDLILAEHENIAEKETTLAKVKEYMINNNFTFDAILTYDDMSVLMASYLANHFNLPSIPFDFSMKIRNKYELRKMSKQLGISVPKFCLIKSKERQTFLDEIKNEAYKLLLTENGEAIQFPVIAKNPHGLGKGLF